ncbi:DUF6221 family protein [Amycolatopsis speibonae]|uniref:DUF6221 family protein n=1 Tax=Amycolatopsis speibonae TaxID=1450224 RepID=A0ABV7P2C4_9PSEU
MKHTNDGAGSRWHPQRLLAEIAAKRSLLQGHGPEHFAVNWDMDGNPDYRIACGACGTDVDPENWPCRHVRLLTLPYDGQPNYREEWRPSVDALCIASIAALAQRPFRTSMSIP